MADVIRTCGSVNSVEAICTYKSANNLIKCLFLPTAMSTVL